MNSSNLIAGLGGAILLTVLNESLKGLNKDMPRIDLVGEEAVQKLSSFIGVNIQDENTLYSTTLVGDLISNAAYYSLIDGDEENLWRNALTSGVVAGVGAIKLPSKLGLDDEPITKSLETKALTMAYYTLGALMTAGILKLLKRTKI